MARVAHCIRVVTFKLTLTSHLHLHKGSSKGDNPSPPTIGDNQLLGHLLPSSSASDDLNELQDDASCAEADTDISAGGG